MRSARAGEGCHRSAAAARAPPRAGTDLSKTRLAHVTSGCARHTMPCLRAIAFRALRPTEATGGTAQGTQCARAWACGEMAGKSSAIPTLMLGQVGKQNQKEQVGWRFELHTSPRHQLDPVRNPRVRNWISGRFRLPAFLSTAQLRNFLDKKTEQGGTYLSIMLN